MIIADQVARVLYELGIRRVYGLPGEDHMALLDSFATAGLEYRAAFTESAAVIMAATEAQVSGLPGVVVLSLAPGVSNGVNGLLNTYLDEIPLILISGQHPADSLPFVVRQGFDIGQLVTPMTKWRAKVTAGMNVPAVLGRAVDEAMTGRPGPVYLEIPDAVALAQPRSDSDVVSRLRARWTAAPEAPSASQAAVSGLAEALAGARRPVLVIGGRRRRLSTEVLDRFASAHRIPVLTSSRQKGLLDGRSPYFAGTYLNGTLEKDLLSRADLVVMIDPESFDFYNKQWNFDAPAVALVDEAFTEWMNPFERLFVGYPDAVLAELSRGDVGGSSEWSEGDVAAYRTGVREALLPSIESLSVAHAIDAALSAWPSDGYLVADAGFGKPIVAMLSEPSGPDSFFASNALSTMGYTIPTAVGLRQAGSRPVLAFLGDGSLLMRAPEIAVGTGEGPGTVYLAIMDRTLTQIAVKQERRDLQTVGVHLPAISCVKLGDALGVEGVDAYSAEEVSEAVARGLAGDKPMLVGAYVDPAPSRILFELLRG
jgi:acetolactate synthase-1/2/3 large subunit